MKYVCSVCGYVYDEAKEGRPFSELPESWVCPVCKAVKSAFVPEKTEEKSAPAASGYVDEDMKELSAGAVSALFSNLARGCEKQYKNEESALFKEIADYFEAATPPVEKAGLEELAELIGKDLSEGYPALRSKAETEGDRGTQRICVWGEKVTNMQKSLLDRYRREGEAFLRNTKVWVCSVCGFIYIGDTPPQLCPVCKVPPWKFDEIEGRANA